MISFCLHIGAAPCVGRPCRNLALCLALVLIAFAAVSFFFLSFRLAWGLLAVAVVSMRQFLVLPPVSVVV